MKKRRLEDRPTVVTLAIVSVVLVLSVALIVEKKSRLGEPEATANAAAIQTVADVTDRATSPAASKSQAEAPSQQPPTSFSIKTIARLPKSEAEVASAFDQAERFRCKIVPAGNPLELSSFTPFVLGIRTGTLGNKPSPASIRRHAFSVGLHVSNSDQRRLPKLSGPLILSHLEDHFVSIQVRIARDPLSQALYLYPEPLAAVAKYQGASITQNVEQAVMDSVRGFRCLGLLVPPGEDLTPGKEPEPQSLRTLVLAHQYLLADATASASQAGPIYELAFIRAREHNGGLELHPFVTSEGRRELHYLGQPRKPIGSSDCDIQAMVHFTDYSHGSMYPTKAVVRQSQVKSQRRFLPAQFETLARQRQLKGDVWDNITVVLDSIIEGTAR